MRLHRFFMFLGAATLVTGIGHAATTASSNTQKPSAATHPAAMASASTATTTSTAPVKSDIPADLAKEAKVSLEAARKTALAHVKNGTVRSDELEREHGKLIYSFDVTVAGKTGITEVNVDAKTGKLIGVHHETATKEKQEAKEEAKESKPPGR